MKGEQESELAVEGGENVPGYGKQGKEENDLQKDKAEHGEEAVGEAEWTDTKWDVPTTTANGHAQSYEYQVLVAR